MNPIDIILLATLGALMLGIVAYLIANKRKGKTSCGCRCQGCPGAGACAAAREAKKPEGDTHVREEV